MTYKNNNHHFSPQLDMILTQLCEGIETPTIKDFKTAHEKERLIEHIENESYPYPLLHCEHQQLKGIGEDCVDCQHLQYNTYKSRYLELAKQHGETHTHTLHAAFDYYSSLITQYRLTECDELLTTVYPACLERGTWSTYYFMAIQALSFLRFKQGRYEQSIEFFHKQIEIMGPNEKIYENMALAYTRLNENKEASVCYAKAILLIRQKPKEEQEFSTLLLGLSIVLENTDDALTVLNAGMDLLKEKYQQPHSLMAKTLTAIGDLHLKRNDLLAAEKNYAEAVTIFIDTCGLETPLTSNAMHKQASVLSQLNQTIKAMPIFLDALKVWVKVDNESFDSTRVVEALMALLGTRDLPDTLRNELIPTLDALQNKITNSPILFNDLNILCLLKFIYELFIVNSDFSRAKECCALFIEHLNKLNTNNLGELSQLRDQLQQESTNILNILQTL
jgi:tetratricopeptide (TPR) repeat protein